MIQVSQLGRPRQCRDPVNKNTSFPPQKLYWHYKHGSKSMTPKNNMAISFPAQASAGLPTRHFLQGGWILQILPVFKHVHRGPVLVENGLRRLHRNPMAQVLQYHRVLATTKSTAWPPGMRNLVVKSHLPRDSACPSEYFNTHENACKIQCCSDECDEGPKT